MTEALVEFVKEACRVGKTHDEIRAVLTESGWMSEQIEGALNSFVDRPYAVPIPRPVVFASPRLIFLNVFYFLVLYLSIYNVVSTLFTLLDHYLPDGLGRMRGSYYSHASIGEAVRWYLAMIVCCVPLVWWSNRIIKIAINETKQHIPRIRLKLIYLTMFIGACVMLGNAVCFIYYFLSGELGLRFMLKLLILAIMTLGIFSYYRLEIKQTESKA